MVKLRRSVDVEIHGTVAPGFEGVRETFLENFRERGEVGASVVCTREGETVVDLWGGKRRDGAPWERETTTVVWSSTKGLVAICFLILVDRGLVDPDAPVASYWPGFAKGAKQSITVRQLLNHRAGLVHVPAKVRVEDLADPEGVRPLLESATPAWTPGSDQGYHAISWGAYAGELFRQITGESVGTFLAREVAAPLGANTHLGLPVDHPARAHVSAVIPNRTRDFLRSALPEALFGKSCETRIYRKIGNARSPVGSAFRSGPSLGPRRFEAMNDPAVTALELPWCGALTNAAGLARIYTPLALGGEAYGVRLCRPETIEPVTRRQSWSERDLVLQKPIGWSQGFVKDELHLFSPHVEAFGHSGMGGSLGLADPKERTAFGYVMNRMDWRVRSPRSVALCRSFYRALGAI